MFLSSTGSERSYSGLGGFNTAVLGNLRSLGTSLEKTLYAISTGYRVNRAADDPAGSVAISRSDERLNALGVAIDNNQRSFTELCGVDGAQKAMLGVLEDIRGNAQRLNGETNVTLRQTLIETVAAQLTALDTLAHSVNMGGKTALNGASKISLGDIAAQALDTKNSYVRTARDNAYVGMAFNRQNAAQSARISGDYQTSAAGAADVFAITTQYGTKSVQLSGGVSDSDALLQINKTLAAIGARAEIYDDGGTKKIAFATDGYGDNYRIEYRSLSGTSVMTNAAATSARGVTGQVRINAENYALSGDYNNSAEESATIRGAASSATGIATNVAFTTANGTASVSITSATDIADAIRQINADADVARLGIRAEISDDGNLIFSTRETGNRAFLDFSDSAGSLFANGRMSQTVTGRDYRPGDGLRVDYVKPEITAALVFDYQKVTSIQDGGVITAPDNFAITTQAKGGVKFYTGDGVSFFDAINYSFRDLTSSGLGLDQLMKEDSSLSIDKNTANALNYLDWTISQVQKEYGALGSFMNYQLASTNEALQALEASTADGRGILADADMAAETLKVVRFQILQQASMSALGGNVNYAQMMTSLLAGAAGN